MEAASRSPRRARGVRLPFPVVGLAVAIASPPAAAYVTREADLWHLGHCAPPAAVVSAAAVHFPLLSAAGGPDDIGLPEITVPEDTPAQRRLGTARAAARERLEAWLLEHGEEIRERRETGVITPGELVARFYNGEPERLFPLDSASTPATVQFDPEVEPLVRQLFHCHQSGSEHEMSPRMVALLAEASYFFQVPVQIVSAYRSPRFCSRPESRHKYGAAADIRLEDIPVDVLADFFTLFSDGPYGPMGVGRYPRDQFVHVDSRDETYFWTGNERRRRRNRHTR